MPKSDNKISALRDRWNGQNFIDEFDQLSLSSSQLDDGEDHMYKLTKIQLAWLKVTPFMQRKLDHLPTNKQVLSLFTNQNDAHLQSSDFLRSRHK